jgi:hypothetical protein
LSISDNKEKGKKYFPSLGNFYTVRIACGGERG